MSSSGKAHHSQTIGRDAELLCAAAHQSNRTLRISKLDRMVILRSKPIFQNKGCDAESIQPVGHLSAFMVHSKVCIGATRRNDDCGANAGPVRLVQGNGWLVLIGLAERSRRASFP